MAGTGTYTSAWCVVTRRSRYVPLVTRDYGFTAVAHGRQLVAGTEVSIRRESGRFRFVNSTVTAAGLTVLNFVGGRAGHEAFRSFYPERVKTVHRIVRTRANVGPA